jgi:hypothetical protein
MSKIESEENTPRSNLLKRVAVVVHLLGDFFSGFLPVMEPLKPCPTLFTPENRPRPAERKPSAVPTTADSAPWATVNEPTKTRISTGSHDYTLRLEFEYSIFMLEKESGQTDYLQPPPIEVAPFVKPSTTALPSPLAMPCLQIERANDEI